MAATGDYLVYVGSYTNPAPSTASASKGIYGFRFDSKTAALTPLGLVAEAANPAYCVALAERALSLRGQLAGG